MNCGSILFLVLGLHAAGAAAEVLLSDGSVLEGTLEVVAGEVVVRPSGGGERRVPWPRFVSARFRRPLRRWVLPEGVEGEGFFLWGRPALLAGKVLLEAPLLGRLEMPAGMVRSLFFRPRPRRVAVPPAPGVRMVNGDLVQGEVLAVGRSRLRLRTPLLGRLSLETARVAAVYLPPARPPGRPAGRWVRLWLVDGEILEVELLALDGEGARLKTAFGAEVELPAGAVLSLHRLPEAGGDVNPLAAAEIRVQPFFPGEAPRPARDAMPDGAPLRVRGREFAYGLCVPSGTVVGLPLPASSRRFLLRLGLHDDWGRCGEVEVRVLLDGRQVWRKEGLKAGELEALNLPLDGASRMEIVVDYGRFADFGDWLVLGEPCLVRE